jgi:hypothetical protein
MRACLRGEFSFAFYGKDETYLHFGYDYYMYFGSKRNIDIQKIKFPDGMFIEENFPSPYLDIDNDDDIKNALWL